VGTQLTTQTCLGFLLTIASIRLVPVIQGSSGWGWASDAGHRAGAGNPGHAGPAPLALRRGDWREDGGDTNSKPPVSFGGKHETP